MDKKDELNLVDQALIAKDRAYVQYSHFLVGAALLCEDNTVHLGCNVENASYGATICAERTAFLKAISEGKQGYKAIAIVGSSSEYTYPCGICRQFISEFVNKDFIYICCNSDGEYIKLQQGDLFPYSFDKNSL